MKVVIKLIPMKAYDILINLLPMIILFSVVMILIRIITAIYSHERIVLYKDFKTLLYVIYCFALFKLVTTSDFESFSNNFLPFREIMRYKTTSPLFYRNVIGNMAIFLPFGYLITDMIKEKAGKCNIFITSAIVFLTSLTIEIIQMYIGRSFDIDDIILNLAGGIIGYLIYQLFHKILTLVPDKWKKDTFKFIFFFLMSVFFVLALIILYEVAK